ncbi:MAG TPA: ribosome-associated translation inhibitor RaiA [Rhabdochlamydiaceae bacterium]|nr:ribosome-associated translation inhibitor RaiA [Rhabdochlamydiaceae bacterium]
MVDVEKFAEEEAMGYNITIIGRNLQVTEAMKNYAWEKLDKIERFHNHIMDAHVTMDIQKLEHSIVIILKIDHVEIKVSASSTDMYPSIDKAIDKLQTKLRRWKSRIQDYHKKGIRVIDMEVNVLRRPPHYDEVADYNAEIEREEKEAKSAALQLPHVIGTETRPLKMLTIDEAVMKLELSGDQFLIFRDEVDQKLKVLYRRTDGDYGLIKPE